MGKSANTGTDRTLKRCPPGAGRCSIAQKEAKDCPLVVKNRSIFTKEDTSQTGDKKYKVDDVDDEDTVNFCLLFSLFLLEFWGCSYPLSGSWAPPSGSPRSKKAGGCNWMSPLWFLLGKFCSSASCCICEIWLRRFFSLLNEHLTGQSRFLWCVFAQETLNRSDIIKDTPQSPLLFCWSLSPLWSPQRMRWRNSYFSLTEEKWNQCKSLSIMLFRFLYHFVIIL